MFSWIDPRSVRSEAMDYGRRQLRPAVGWLYLAMFIAVGFALSLLGPSLTYLRERAHVSKGTIGVLFAAQSLGYLLGALLSGRFYDRGAGHRAVAGALAGLAGTALLIPHATSVLALCVPFALIGCFAGCLDVGGNVLVVWHSRRTGSSQLLNALHLFFGIGAVLTPPLVNRSLAYSHGLGIAAGLLAGYALVIAVLALMHSAPEPGVVAGQTTQVFAPTRILGVIGFFFFLYVGVEVGFSGWIKTYAEGLHLPGIDTPTWLNTAFWVCFTLGRLIATILSKRIRPGRLLFGSCAASVALLMVMVAADGQIAAVWITTILLGFALAPQFASMIAYAEERITLSGRSTSWFISASGIGGLLLPWLIGSLIDRSGSGAMPLTVLAAAIASTAWLLVVRRQLARNFA